MMRKILYTTAQAFIFLTLFLFGEDEVKDKSIVPPQNQIDDSEVRLNIAKIFSYYKETQQAAVRLYASLLKDSKEDPNAIIKGTTIFEDFEVKPSQKVKSLVSKEGEVSDFDVLVALARIYTHDKDTWCKALSLYRGLLAERPDKVDLYIEMGRLLINLKKLAEGLVLFYEGLSLFPDNPELLVATAQGEVASGYAARARDHFLKALCIIETGKKTSNVDHPDKEEKPLFTVEGYNKTLIDFADGMIMWGDFYQAEGIFRYVVSQWPEKLDYYLKLAWVLSVEERYEEAEEIYKYLLDCDPNEHKVLLALARMKFLEKKFDDAMVYTEDLLEIDVNGTEYLKLKADILFMQKRYCEAIAFYATFLEDVDLGIDGYIGIGRSLQRLGWTMEAYEAFERGFALAPTNVKIQFYLVGECAKGCEFIDYIIDNAETAEELVEWGKVYIENGLPDQALRYYRAAAEMDPEHLPAILGYAETLSITYRYQDALDIYEELLDLFPGNSKSMLSIARVTGWSKHYDLSIDRYDEIISEHPEDPVLYREKARTALWGHKFNIGMETYDELLERSVESLADELIHTSIYLEKKAKALVWNKRYIHSLQAYQKLLAFNPGNEDGLFDYAQSFCDLNLCDCAANVYDTILNLDPSHNLAKQASARNDLKCHPIIQNNVSYWREIGTGTFSQSQIARYKWETVYEQPLTCRAHLRFLQQEYVENPFYNYKFYPAIGQSVEADYIINANVSAFVSATYKNYFGKFKPTITSRNWLLFNANDYFRVLLSCNKIDEIYNYFSLKQKIQSINTIAKVSADFTHAWSASATYENYRYNDHNKQNHVNLYTEYQFTDTPYIFKLILQGDYRNTLHDTINIVVGTTLVDVIHPYWTPIDYYAGSLTFETLYDYREFVYCESPQRYVDLKITGSTDSVNNPGIQVIFEWKHEFFRHWGFEVKGLLHRSKQWNAEGAWGTFYYRF